MNKDSIVIKEKILKIFNRTVKIWLAEVNVANNKRAERIFVKILH